MLDSRASVSVSVHKKTPDPGQLGGFKATQIPAKQIACSFFKAQSITFYLQYFKTTFIKTCYVVHRDTLQMVSSTMRHHHEALDIPNRSCGSKPTMCHHHEASDIPNRSCGSKQRLTYLKVLVYNRMYL